MGSKKIKTTSQETATTTPNVPSVAQGPTNDYYTKVGNYLNGNPADYMAPINSALQSVFGAAGASQQDVNPSQLFLGGGNGGPAGGATSFVGQANPAYADALARTSAAANALGQLGPAQLSTANATDVAGIGPRGVSQASLASLGPASLAEAANAGNASQVGLRGYDPTSVNLRGYDAATVGDTGRFLDNSVERIQAQSLLNNLNGYMNPYLSQVVDTTAADYDQYAGQQRAELARRGAAAGAFGGSGYGLAQGQAEGELARGRASTLAGLRSDAFNTAAGLSNLDAARRQEAGMFNAGAQNERDLARGQLGFQGALYNAGAQNDARAFGANAFNTGALSNQAAGNAARQFGANAFNTGALANQDATNNFALQNAGFRQQTNLANADAQNRYGLEAFNAANQLSQFNTGAQNDAAAQQYGVQAQNAQQNAAAANATSQFNAGAANNMSQFNSQQDLSRIAQQLGAANQTASIAGNQAANTRADIGLQGDIGQRLYELQQAQSPLGQLGTAGALLDPQLLSILTGQTINSNGTSTQKQSGGLGSSLLGGLFSLGSGALSGGYI